MAVSDSSVCLRERCRDREKQEILFPLMVSFVVIVLQEFDKSSPE